MDSTASNAFMIHIYLPESTTNKIVSLVSSHLEIMQKEGSLDPSEALHSTMSVDAATNIHATTFLDNETIASGIYLIASL